MDYKNCKLDEQLIHEVQFHGVIYNRQKYFFNNSSGGTGKYESKDEAWQVIAMKLNTDVDTCKKRWKYLRERYVSQRKQSDPPVYEHLSRPYLEKMKFLDQHIQPRKSYRNVSSFLTSGGSSYSEYNMDSSRSNGSIKNNYPNYHENMFVGNNLTDLNGSGGSSTVKTEPEQAFREFAAALASQQNQQAQFYNHIPPSVSSSSSMKSPQSSSCSGNNDNNDPGTSDNMQMQQKKPRVQNDDILNSTPFPNQQHNSQPTQNDQNQIVNPNNNYNSPRIGKQDSVLDSSDDNECISEPPDIVQPHVNSHNLSGNVPNHNNLNGRNSNNSQENIAAAAAAAASFQNNDFLFQLSQHLPSHLRQIRSSEQLLGELVTAELIKMSKDRRRTAQKKILEILFFDD